MGLLKSLALGFLAATGLIWTCNLFAVFSSGGWLNFTLILIILFSVTSLTILGYRKIANKQPTKWSDKLRTTLFALHGAALACWMFDITTTIYAIDITGMAYELNPLGWPWGILGALAYYGPAFGFSYVLLYKLKDTAALIGALPLTLITLVMAAMNLHAGTQNLGYFIGTEALVTEIRYGVLAALVSVNVAAPTLLRKTQIR